MPTKEHGFRSDVSQSETRWEYISQKACTVQHKTRYVMHYFYYLKGNLLMFDNYKQIGECCAPGYNNISSQLPIRKLSH